MRRRAHQLAYVRPPCAGNLPLADALPVLPAPDLAASLPAPAAFSAQAAGRASQPFASGRVDGLGWQGWPHPNSYFQGRATAAIVSAAAIRNQCACSRQNWITRPVLEDYISWLLTQGYSASTRALSLSMIRVFFDACHRHGWLAGLAASATIYVEELPFHHDEIARFIPEFVMAQLESEQALAKIPHATTRNLVVVMIETGLRGGDA